VATLSSSEQEHTASGHAVLTALPLSLPEPVWWQGLGKTVQVAVFLSALAASGLYRTSLVVCPATVLRQVGSGCWWPDLAAMWRAVGTSSWAVQVCRAAAFHACGRLPGTSLEFCLLTLSKIPRGSSQVGSKGFV